MGVGEAADNKPSDAVKAVVVNFMLAGRDSWMGRVCVSQELVLGLWNTPNRRRAPSCCSYRLRDFAQPNCFHHNNFSVVFERAFGRKWRI